MNKKKSKWAIGLVLVAVVSAVAVVAVFASSRINAGGAFIDVSYTELYPGELSNSISVKGIVESVDKENVYSTLNLTVKTVNVEIGDRVTEGQILCEMDTDDLELDIAKQKADLSVSQRNSLNQLENSQRVYNEANAKLKSGTNNQITSADTSLKTAEINLETAQRDYENAVRDYETNKNSQVVNAESTLTSAKLDLETKETTFENNKVLYEIDAISKTEYDASEDAYASALNKYNDAVTSLENAKTAQDRALEQADRTLKTAQVNYENALASKDSSVTNANQDLESYKNNLEASQISMNKDSQLITIQKLEKQLEDSVIKAPISGTITAVYAKEGATGSGLLFVIEDTDSLKIITRIKEYDVGHVKTGMPVSIKSDSTGDAVYEGVISKIDPTAIKNSAGETDTSSDVEFKTTVDVTSEKTELKIGANTRMTVLIEKKDKTYYVPYDAVSTNLSGESVVYAAIQDGQGKYTAKQIPITTGMETDFYMEISGDGLTDGLMILNDAAAIQDGAQVSLSR